MGQVAIGIVRTETVCPATVRVEKGKHFPRDWKAWYDSKKDAIADQADIDGATLECCLYEPHEGFKHMNPRLVRTLGGMSLNIPGWSSGIERED